MRSCRFALIRSTGVRARRRIRDPRKNRGHRIRAHRSRSSVPNTPARKTRIQVRNSRDNRSSRSKDKETGPARIHIPRKPFAEAGPDNKDGRNRSDLRSGMPVARDPSKL